MLLLLGLLVSPFVLGAASTATTDLFAIDFHFLGAQSGYAAQGPITAIPAKSDLAGDLNLDEALVSENLSSGDSLDSVTSLAFRDADNAFQPDPRPRMRKWMLCVLVIGGLIRYLTSPTYKQFVSDVLGPLSWSD